MRREDVLCFAGEGRLVVQQGQEQNIADPSQVYVVMCTGLDSPLHPLMALLITSVPGTLLSFGGAVGKQPDLSNFFMELKTQKHG